MKIYYDQEPQEVGVGGSALEYAMLVVMMMKILTRQDTWDTVPFSAVPCWEW